MTHEQIEAAIERLSILDDDNRRYSMRDVVRALIGEDSAPIRLSHTIAYLLQQADPDTHVELPRDTDGVPIHIGDEMDFCDGVRGLTVIGIGTSSANDSDMGVFVRDDDGYMWYNARFLHHHRAPTVEDVLVDYYKECRLHASELGFVTDEGKEKAWRDIATTFAAKLREVMQDD